MIEKADEAEMIAFYEKYGFQNKEANTELISGISTPSVVLIKENR